MKKYLVILTGDVNDADYIRNIQFLDESELNELKEEILAAKRIRKSLTNGPSEDYGRSYTDNMVYLETVLNILKVHKNPYGKLTNDLEEWVRTLPKEDIDKFFSFSNRFPNVCEEYVHTVVSIEVYEVVNSKPINLI